jgi:hypothetical protein
MRKLVILAAAAATASLAAAAPSVAHHAVNAQFDVTREVELTGTLTKVQNVAPHARWNLDIKTDQGATENWFFESASPAVLRRAGIRVREDIKVGDTYTFFFNPPRGNQKAGYLRAMTIKGKKVPITNLADVRNTDE